MGLAIDVTNAVVDQVNASGRPYSAAVAASAVRVHRLDVDLRDLATLHVRVFLAKRASEDFTNAKRKLTFTVDVGVQKKLQPHSLTEQADPLLNLAEQLADWFDTKDRKLDAGGVRCRITEVDAPLAGDYDHLANHCVFTSVISLKIEAIV